MNPTDPNQPQTDPNANPMGAPTAVDPMAQAPVAGAPGVVTPVPMADPTGPAPVEPSASESVVPPMGEQPAEGTPGTDQGGMPPTVPPAA